MKSFFLDQCQSKGFVEGGDGEYSKERERLYAPLVSGDGQRLGAFESCPENP